MLVQLIRYLTYFFIIFVISWPAFSEDETFNEEKILDSKGVVFKINYTKKDSDEKMVKLFYDDGTTVKEVANYKSGKLTERLQYDRESRLSARMEYKDGTLIKMTHYYPDGKVRIESYYPENAEVGYSKTYYENGQLKSEVPTLNGQWHGEEKRYDENGNATQIITYEAGKPIGQKNLGGPSPQSMRGTSGS